MDAALPGKVPLKPLLLRAAAYFLFWIVLAGTAPKDLAAGAVTAVIAAWASLGLLPPGELAFRPMPACTLFLRFLLQSLVTGISVARIALHPDMPLRPGRSVYRTALPLGQRRFAFMTFASLLPGTLPMGTDESGQIEVHVLDTAQDAAGQLRAEEDRLAAAFVLRGAA